MKPNYLEESQIDDNQPDLTVDLSDDDAKKWGMELSEQVKSAENSIESIKNKWDSVLDAYNCDPKSSQMRLVEGIDPYVFPLYRQKAGAISSSLSSAYFSIKPWAQLISVDSQIKVDDVERTMQSWLEKSRLKNQARNAFLNMIHFNCGIMRIVISDSGQLIADVVHPKDSVMYPPLTNDYKKLKTMGHAFELMRWQIREKVDSGEYREVNVDALGRAPQPDNSYNAMQVQDDPTKAEDEKVRLHQLVTKIKMKSDKKHELYLVTIEAQSCQILQIEKYPYSRPWYFCFKTSDYEDSMYPSDAVGNVLTKLQHSYNDVFTICIQGALMAAFPLVVVTGGSITNKAQKYSPGQLIESADDLKVSIVGTRFEPGMLPALGTKFEELADGVSGVSRLGTAQNLPASTTATAASGFLAAQAEAKDSYVEAIETAMKDLLEFCLELMNTHADRVANFLGGQYQVDMAFDPSLCIVQPTGSGATTDPRLLAQKLAMLQQMAMDPNSPYDPMKVQEKVVETLDMPFETASLKKDGIDESGMAAAETIPGMEGILQGTGVPEAQFDPNAIDFQTGGGF